MDRTTGAELAARAGLVLDNARMYTYQENVADTLQDSMLPNVEPPAWPVATSPPAICPAPGSAGSAATGSTR